MHMSEVERHRPGLDGGLLPEFCDCGMRKLCRSPGPAPDVETCKTEAMKSERKTSGPAVEGRADNTNTDSYRNARIQPEGKRKSPGGSSSLSMRQLSEVPQTRRLGVRLSQQMRERR